MLKSTKCKKVLNVTNIKKCIIVKYVLKIEYL